MAEEQQYCISAKNRNTGVTEAITYSMSKQEAETWKPKYLDKANFSYFRVSKHPFKAHVKK